MNPTLVRLPARLLLLLTLVACGGAAASCTQRVGTSGAAAVAEAATASLLGEHDALRTYTEFTDGKDRGLYDPASGGKGYPDEDYDATTAMVVNWHRAPEADTAREARLRYRQVHPTESAWLVARGNTAAFWHREERINRVVLKDLEPDAVYAYQVTPAGRTFHFRTMPSSLAERPVKLILTGDHQQPEWTRVAHENAQLAALQKPDMFVVSGDFMSKDGDPHDPTAAEAWARYLDVLYGVDGGYFIYDDEIDGRTFENLVIPHVVAVGNHDIYGQLMDPADVNTSGMGEYNDFVGPNWLELLFHFPFSSEGFYGEVRPDHPNVRESHLVPGFNRGGYGSLSFGDYLLLISLNNIQAWAGEADPGLRDWEGHLITERWPWYGEVQADFRQDEWLRRTLEKGSYTHVIPVYHRALFGGTRLNMSHKNRDVLKYWMPLFYEHGVRIIKEGHEHVYTRTVPFRVTDCLPGETSFEKRYYEPRGEWSLTPNLPQAYLDDYYAVDAMIDRATGEVVGWAYDGVCTTYDPEGMIAIGNGGWAAGRRSPGERQAGNAGWWFVDEAHGGDVFGGDESFHMTTVHLSEDAVEVESFTPDQLPHFSDGTAPEPMHRFKWDMREAAWRAFDFQRGEWVDYGDARLSRTGE